MSTISKDWKYYLEMTFTPMVGSIYKIGRYYNTEKEKMELVFEAGQLYPHAKIRSYTDREVTEEEG